VIREANKRVETDIGSTVLKMLGSLILILAMIFGLFYFLKKARGGTFAFAKNPLRLVSLLNLGPRRSVALVEVNQQWLVLGVTADRITLLDKMPQPPQSPAGDRAASGGFQALLKQSLFKNSFKRRQKPRSADGEIDPKE
jgi:flagellar protein FliO/FliZ